MSAEWFVRQNDKVHGPFDAATVKQFAATNRIGVNTLIARSADGPWHPASKVKGLFPDALAPRQLRVFLPVTRKAMPLKPWNREKQ